MKKKIIKPLLTVIPLSTSLLMNIGTASAEDIYIEGVYVNDVSINANNITAAINSKVTNNGSASASEVFANQGNWSNSTISSSISASTLNQFDKILNLGSIEAYDFSTYSGSKTQNQGEITVTHVLLNEGNWTNEGTSSSLNAATLNQKATILNQGLIEAVDFSTYSGSTTQNQNEVTVTHVLSNEGSWTNEGTSSSLSAVTLTQKALMLNQGSVEATNITTFDGSNSQNQGEVAVTNAFVNKGTWSNSASGSSLSAITLNQENQMLNLGSIEANNMTTFAGSSTENQGTVSLNNVLVNKGNWTNGGTNSKITASSLNQEATMLNQGSIIVTNMTTLEGSSTENQGSIKVNNILANKGDWINGTSSSSLNAAILNQESTMLNQGSIVSTDFTTYLGSSTENQGSVKVNNVLSNKGEWTNGTAESTLNAATLNQENYLFNIGSVTATDLTTFAGSETINQANVKVNNVLANKGSWINRTVDSVLDVSTLNQEETMTNYGSVTATNMTTFAGSETENRGNVKVNNVLANKGTWTNSISSSKLTASTLNQESQMLNLGSITATDFSTFSGSNTENQGSVKVNNVLSNDGNWTNGGSNSSLNASTINQKYRMLNQGSIIATDFSTYADSRTENQGSVTVNNALSNEGYWINGTPDSSLTVATLNQKDRMLNLGSITATDFTTYADSRTENQGDVTVSHVLANKGNWINGGENSVITAEVLNQEDRMLNQGSVTATNMTTFDGSRTENQGEVSVSAVLANKGNWINGGENSSLYAQTLNQEKQMLNQGVVEANNMTTFVNSITDNQGEIEVNNVLVNKGNLQNSTTDSKITASTLNQESELLNLGSIISTNMATLEGSSTENRGSVKVNNTLSNKGTWSNRGADSSLNASSINQESEMLNQGSIVSTYITTIADSNTENQGSVKVNNTLTNKGTWTNKGADSSLNASSINQESEMLNQGSIVSTYITTTADSETDNKGSVKVNNTLSNKGTWTNSTAASTLSASSVNNEAGAAFENSGSVGSSSQHVTNINNMSGASSFVNNGTGKIYATTITNNAPMENKSGGYIYSDDYINNDTLTNNGSVQLIRNFNNASDASVTNNGVEGQGNLQVFNGSNNGDITQGNMTITSTGVFNNNDNGTINIETMLSNSGSLNNTNEINVKNSTNDAMLINTNTINSTSGTIIADKLTNNFLASMNLTNSNVAIVYQSDDIIGTINVLGGSNDETDLTITGENPTFRGNLNVGNGTSKPVLNLLSGDVTKAAKVSITSGSVVNVDDSGSSGTSSIVIDGTDSLSGDINNVSGDVEFYGKTVNTGAKSTTEGGNKPYYSQTNGSLKLASSVLTMEDSSVINGNGSIFVDGNSKFNSNNGTFTVSDLQNSGLVNGINGTYEAYVAKNNLIVGTNGDEQADFTTDLYIRSNATKKYDKYGSSSAVLSAGSASRHGVLNISDFKIHGDMFGKDAPVDREIVLGNLFEYGSVNAGDRIDFKATNKTIKTALGDYRLISKGNGNYAFALKSFSPRVYRGQVTTLAQYQNQLAIDDMLFNHTMVNNGFKGNDYLSSHPNLYASSSDLYAPYQYSRKDGGLWVKSYGTFEKLKLTSVDADNISYGTLIGADFGLKNLKRGWQFMPTAYMGYNGANQRWDGFDAYQNGGQLGFLGTWYKNNFMIGTLAYGGLYFNDMKTPKGTDDTVGYFLGAATKTAYNWRIKRDFSLQPNLLLSYNFFGKQDWNTSFGQMDMQTGMLNGINIAPGLNFIWEKETFSMYATLQYMININDGVTGKAGNVDLPKQKMDSMGYVQYGIGVNKQFTDRFSGFFQAVFRNLSRTGLGLQVGVNFKLGKSHASNPNKKSTKLPKRQKTKMNVSSSKTSK